MGDRGGGIVRDALQLPLGEEPREGDGLAALGLVRQQLGRGLRPEVRPARQLQHAHGGHVQLASGSAERRDDPRRRGGRLAYDDWLLLPAAQKASMACQRVGDQVARGKRHRRQRACVMRSLERRDRRRDELGLWLQQWVVEPAGVRWQHGVLVVVLGAVEDHLWLVAVWCLLCMAAHAAAQPPSAAAAAAVQLARSHIRSMIRSRLESLPIVSTVLYDSAF